ncbi:hypothetical protein BCR32DRAFT_130516 [Anaeromyces robustus]|uniref:RNA-polymerase II-associated protein 3-like C-terminal domain-containing protein n=1 Tax=Anaeromyces robustus TaxID=1754192 RepID=A0A1Y1XF69_9FUNG|nr:hypothetical protein BCR32DRAFT_130516 [Anaeromyces robustus]|eukprot:ORX84332.1 hypothetical protein BCR32DRAFT_130516 [Anaeromyces robustus]
MNKDIEEINEMMKNNDILNDKQRPISLTETNKEESFSSLDMVPVSTTKKENTKPKKQPKKMKIMEKGEENENKENIKEKEINEKKEKEKEKEMDKIEEKPKIELKTSSNKELEKETSIQEKRTESEIKPVKKIETKKSKDLLNTNNNALLSSFIFNKDDKEEKEIEQTQQQQQQQITEQKKTKLNKKRSVVIEEMDEIITEIKPLEPLNETILDNKENVKKEHQITTSPIEEENNNDNKNKPILQENKIEEIKEEKKNENEKKIDNSFKSSSPSPSPSPSRNIRSKVNVATTMYDFERDWKSMRNDDNKTFEYLSSIIPENLPNLFKNSLESDYLTRILIIMNKFYIEESMFNEMYALLNSLQKVNRFEMTLMFMSRKDKQVLKNIFDAMKSNQSSANFSITDLEALAKKYKMTL